MLASRFNLNVMDKVVEPPAIIMHFSFSPVRKNVSPKVYLYVMCLFVCLFVSDKDEEAGHQNVDQQ